MSEQQPDVRWAPIPPKPRNRGRVWLIVGLSVAAVIIVALLLFFLIPRDDGQPVGTPTPTASSSATQIPTPIPSPSPGATAPAETPPPVADPTVETFRTQVAPWLDDALTGLDIMTDASGPDALSVLDTLQGDAQRLADAQPPSSMDPQWRDGVSAYSQRLVELRSAVSAGSATDDAIEAARSEAQNLRALVGL